MQALGWILKHGGEEVMNVRIGDLMHVIEHEKQIVGEIEQLVTEHRA